VTRAAVLRDATQGSGSSQFAVIQAAAPSLGVEVKPVSMRDAEEIERAVTAFARSPGGGLIVAAGPAATRHRDLIIKLGGPAQAARGLLRTLLRCRRRSDLLRA
jgi:putative ABC transport system substrate-binding protein